MKTKKRNPGTIRRRKMALESLWMFLVGFPEAPFHLAGAALRKSAKEMLQLRLSQQGKLPLDHAWIARRSKLLTLRYITRYCLSPEQLQEYRLRADKQAEFFLRLSLGEV